MLLHQIQNKPLCFLYSNLFQFKHLFCEIQYRFVTFTNHCIFVFILSFSTVSKLFKIQHFSCLCYQITTKEYLADQCCFFKTFMRRTLRKTLLDLKAERVQYLHHQSNLKLNISRVFSSTTVACIGPPIFIIQCRLKPVSLYHFVRVNCGPVILCKMENQCCVFCKANIFTHFLTVGRLFQTAYDQAAVIRLLMLRLRSNVLFTVTLILIE